MLTRVFPKFSLLKSLGESLPIGLKDNAQSAILCTAVVFCSYACSQELCGDERLQGIACRSVHLNYPGEDATAFYNEITVRESAPGTYFSVIGWDKGYFGIQQLASNQKLVIFSVWDSGENDPNATQKELRTKLLFKDPNLRVKRFGGEGSGGQSFYDLDWQVGQTYRFMLCCNILGNRTAYSGLMVDPETNRWKHLVTFSTITGGRPMSRFYSFVEDFKRDRESAKRARIAEFGNAFRLPTNSDDWVFQKHAKFTADANPVLNIDAQFIGNRFQLATGGETTNNHAALQSTLTNDAAADRMALKGAEQAIESAITASQQP